MGKGVIIMEVDIRNCLAGMKEICILIEPGDIGKAEWLQDHGDPAHLSAKDRLIIALIEYGAIKGVL
jgi:hypothetical protein